MNDNDLMTRREVELALLEKGQKSRRYKLGEIWELNFDEIREALSEYQPNIVCCKDCKYWLPMNRFHSDYHPGRGECELNCWVRDFNWFCADGERRDDDG